MVRLVVPLFGAAIAYTDHTYSDRMPCVGGTVDVRNAHVKIHAWGEGQLHQWAN